MSPAVRILAGLGLGLGTGVALAASGATDGHGAVQAVATAGGMWLDALRMTVLPLIFSLVVTGVAATAGMAAAGHVTRLSFVLFVLLLLASAALTALLVPLLLAAWPTPEPAAAALRQSLGALGEMGDQPGIAQTLRAMIPTNVVNAASSGAMLPVVFFAFVFGLAITRLEGDGRAGLLAFFTWIREAMLVIVGWVLKIAPFGVFALALVVGVKTGFTALGAFAHFVGLVVLMCLIGIASAYGVAALLGRVSPVRFARAAAPAQAIAFSTQSSIASLPAMLKGCETQLGIPPRVTGVTLPLAVSVFRIAGPLAVLTVGIYAAHVMNVPLDAARLTAGALMAVLVVNAVGGGFPAQIVYFASMSPVLAIMGVPLEILGLLIAVETINDMFRTTANVTMDMAVTTAVARFSQEPAAEDNALPADPQER